MRICLRPLKMFFYSAKLCCLLRSGRLLWIIIAPSEILNVFKRTRREIVKNGWTDDSARILMLDFCFVHFVNQTVSRSFRCIGCHQCTILRPIGDHPEPKHLPYTVQFGTSVDTLKNH